MRSNAPSGSGELSEIGTSGLTESVPDIIGQCQGSPINRINDPGSGMIILPAPSTNTGNEWSSNNASDFSSLYLDQETTVFMAAARVDDPSKDREFRSAQRRNYSTGERPRSSINDRRCMAALVRVNGLEAYALLDSGSTTISVTHDFARVAKLNVMQLENPITLQLGTVGSRSMINFGSKASLELGAIKDDDAYLDVVNIDRYDMIIGTPFMRKHGLILDFASNTLSHKGRPVPTLSAGQEDLMISQKRSARVYTPAGGGTILRSNL
jgi:hypothetical protein